MWFVALIMGSLTGDYLLQGKWMALNKTKDWRIALLHSVIYTVCIVLWLLYFGYPLTWFIFGLVLLSHWPIDYLTFGKYKETIPALWLRAIGVRNIIDEQNNDVSPNKEVRVAFACACYLISDNAMHLVLLVLFLKPLLGG